MAIFNRRRNETQDGGRLPPLQGGTAWERIAASAPPPRNDRDGRRHSSALRAPSLEGEGTGGTHPLRRKASPTGGAEDGPPRSSAPTSGAETGLPGISPAAGQMPDAQGQAVRGMVFEQRGEEELQPSVITVDSIREAMHTLRRYKAGKANLEARVIENEQWWKLRHWNYIKEKGTTELKTKSAWLVNVILSKHADAMDAMPEPNCLPQEETDQATAEELTEILPVILRQTDFELTWSDNWWKKLKAGFAVYGVFWDKDALNGLGEISIRVIDPLNLFWEPGIRDIQNSRNVFHVELQDNDSLIERYPQLEGKLGAKTFSASKYNYDDTVDTSEKTAVIDWYYKKNVGGKVTLQYVKFVNEEILYSTENDVVSPTEYMPYPEAGTVDPELPAAERGLYDHGMYPFFFDVLFPEEGTPAGYGYIDICKDAQRQIDLMNNAVVANCIAAATPRWLKRGDDGINEEEYADWSRPFVHVQGSIEEASLRQIQVAPLSGNYISILQAKIDELKETSGNRDVANGGTSAGATAASAIAAMQEASGKLSRDQIQNSYRCFRGVTYCVIELIRQFYKAPRKFRITGPEGIRFVTFNNRAMQGKPLGPGPDGKDMGLSMPPQYDVEVNAQRQTAYSKMSQNELALQFYNLGFFNPQMTDQTLCALRMMEFKGKDEVVKRVEENGTLYDQLQMAIQTIQQLTAALQGGAEDGPPRSSAPTRGASGERIATSASPPRNDKAGRIAAGGETGNRYVEKARIQAQQSTQPR